MLYKVLNNFRLRFFSFFFLGAIILFVNFSTFSQDTLVGKSTTVSIEGQVYPAFNADTYRPQFKVRLNLNDHSAIRLNSSFSRDVAYNEILEIGGNGVGSVEKISSMYTFALGYEGQKKIKNAVIYGGIEGVLGFGRNDEYGSRTDSISFIPDINYNYQRPVQQMGVRIFSGLDYYIGSNLYFGTEMGLSLLQTNYNTGSYNRENVSSLTDPNETTIIAKSKVSNLSFNGIGVIRVGWRF
jgi:hypothetical protein